jgi:hypothetical protein
MSAAGIPARPARRERRNPSPFICGLREAGRLRQRMRASRACALRTASGRAASRDSICATGRCWIHRTECAREFAAVECTKASITRRRGGQRSRCRRDIMPESQTADFSAAPIPRYRRLTASTVLPAARGQVVNAGRSTDRSIFQAPGVGLRRDRSLFQDQQRTPQAQDATAGQAIVAHASALGRQ